MWKVNESSECSIPKMLLGLGWNSPHTQSSKGVLQESPWNRVKYGWGEMKVRLLSCVRLFVTPWTVAYQAPQSMELSRQEYWEWIAISFSRVSSQPRDWIQVSRTAGRRFTVWATRGARVKWSPQQKLKKMPAQGEPRWSWWCPQTLSCSFLHWNQKPGGFWLLTSVKC